MIATALLAFGLPLWVQSDDRYTPGEPSGKTFDDALAFLDLNCLTCHDNDTMKGDLSLEELGPPDEANAGLWKSVWAQVTLKEMPPKNKKQPAVVDRLLFTDWVVEQLVESMKDKGGFTSHLDPRKGNFLDHGLLFGELPKRIQLQPTSSPARLWRVSKEEYITRLNEFIHQEPAYNPEQPGRRTHGDAVPVDSTGALRVHLGAERVIRAKDADFTAGIKSYGPVFSAVPLYGLENYPDLYSVNGAESLQILDMAREFLRYMAYGPLSFAVPGQILATKHGGERKHNVHFVIAQQ
ncbi:MAG: c-type cytochrome domain-containing protein [Verrucomicrobiota bacterium]